MKISLPGDDISFHGCSRAIAIYSCLEDKEPEPSAPTHQDVWATREGGIEKALKWSPPF